MSRVEVIVAVATFLHVLPASSGDLTCPNHCTNSACDPDTAQCSYGCEAQWGGAWCDVTLSDNPSKTSQGFQNSDLSEFVAAGDYPNIMTGWRAGINGLVTQITTYGTSPGPVYITAWRKTGNGVLPLVLVAKYLVTIIKDKKVEIMPSNSIFYVQASDVIGFHYKSVDGRGKLKLLKKHGTLTYLNLRRTFTNDLVNIDTEIRDVDVIRPEATDLRSVAISLLIAPLTSACPPGTTGYPNCESPCAPGYWGWNCSRPCSKCRDGHCSVLTGRCRGSCVDGYYGPNCTACPTGQYGSNCSSTCSGRCEKDMCHPVSGSCVCIPGWTGSYCSEPCGKGFFGTNCSTICGHCDCDHVTGGCVSSCESGYKGNGCSEVCPVGVYGANCSSTCGYCAAATCHHVNGSCNPCMPGWTGSSCHEACPTGSYGTDCLGMCSEYCLNDASCDHVTGHCPQGCRAGWTDVLCDVKCISGTFGDNCSQACSNCPECDHATGVCEHCFAGWTGDRCNEVCASGQYGVNCSSTCGYCEDTCQSQTGSCDCLPGYRGGTCNQECTPGFYGKNCSQRCGQCLSNCSHVRGSCDCSPGYRGDTCNLECKEGFFGLNCSSICGFCFGNTSCHHVTGICPDDKYQCLEGWAGVYCNVTTQLLPIMNECVNCECNGFCCSPAPCTLISVGVTLAVIVAVITIIAVIVLRRKRRMTAEVVEAGEVESILHSNVKLDPEGGADQVRLLEVSTKLCLADIYEYINQRKSEFEPFQSEYQSAPIGKTKPWMSAERPEVQNKNRFKNILPYDYNRVVLKELSPTGSDYINASHIRGFQDDSYIASHGPLQRTIDDFWRMIWEQDVHEVVMLTGLVEDMKPKCDRYWPEGQSVYGRITVTLESEDVWPDFTVRIFSVNERTETRSLRQYHYTTWPDHGVPDYPGALLRMRSRLRRSSVGRCVLVHCSAGVGRTGTFIALDLILRQVEGGQDWIDVKTQLRELREQRINMIQTLDQYVFLYDALHEGITFRSSSTTAQQFHEEFIRINSDRLQNLYQLLYHFKPTFDTDEFVEGLRHPEFNRDPEILPAEKHRVFLTSTTSHTDSYINCVPVQGYRHARSYYCTQLPLPCTVAHFWHLVEMLQLTCIVSLDLDPDSTWCPSSTLQFHRTYVHKISSSVQDDLRVTEVKVYTQPLTSSLGVHVFELLRWTPRTLIDLYHCVMRCQQKSRDRPAVVMCRNGADRSGVFIAVSVLLDILNAEQEVDVAQVVRQIRVTRPQFIISPEQLYFLYTVIDCYLLDFGDYSNFK